MGSLVLLILIAAGIAVWFVFTPDKLTPAINRQFGKFITCQAAVERVELTFFSSFPQLGLKADGILLLNPTAGAPCDTLARIDRLDAVVDVKAFLKRKELILSDISLKNGAVYLYADSLGKTNYDIMAPSDSGTDKSAGTFTISSINADNITFDNIDILYVDDAYPMRADVKRLSSVIKGSMIGGDIRGKLAAEPFDIDFSMGRTDSLMTVSARGLSLEAGVSMAGDRADADLKIPAAAVTFAYAGEEYLTDGQAALSAAVSADIKEQSATIRNGALKLNGLELLLDGTLRNDTVRGLDMDLKYKLEQWPLTEVLALIPKSFRSQLDGVEASGNLSAEGTAAGIYGEGSMPVFDMHLVLNEGGVAYPAMLPYPLRSVFADLNLHTDFEDDAESFVKINTLRAHTPRSSLRASGTLDRLFSDPHAIVTADLTGDLTDARPFIPDSLNLVVSGKASGRVKADVRMSQLEKMELEKMKVSGSMLLTGLDARNDTIAVATPSLKLDFSLPNNSPSGRNVSFAAAGLVSNRLDASMADGSEISLTGMRIALETSDVRDTLMIPVIVCGFSMDSLAGKMGGMELAVAKPSGKIEMASGRRNAAIPRIKVRYDGGRLSAGMEDMSAVVEKLNIDATVVYDESKKDIWQILMPRGSVSAAGVVVNTSALNYPVEIPELAMDCTPFTFNVENAHVKLNRSDFSLNGTVDNVLPYARGDSVLRGEFNFSSPVTDISQLLALTSGIGSGEETSADTPADEFSGPYMVPEGIDITLHTQIDRALWYGEDISKIMEFSKIHGDITIRDGAVYVTPELSFSSPATDGEITLQYRTPRKNHLFASVLLHLTDIDIAEALDMIPDLDTIMPMLRSFDGNAEFHLNVEGYMDSTYKFKMSTLRGGCSISGTDLVLRDEDLFRKVAKFMKYKDEGVIRVDSLSADFTIFRDAVTIYPFLFSVDRYKAVISGNHNLDMSFDYNISLVQSPIPFRVAVTVKGRPDDFKFSLSKSRYPDFYRPKRSTEVVTREMEMRQRIRSELLKTTAANRNKEDDTEE